MKAYWIILIVIGALIVGYAIKIVIEQGQQVNANKKAQKNGTMKEILGVITRDTTGGDDGNGSGTVEVVPAYNFPGALPPAIAPYVA